MWLSATDEEAERHALEVKAQQEVAQDMQQQQQAAGLAAFQQAFPVDADAGLHQPDQGGGRRLDRSRHLTAGIGFQIHRLLDHVPARCNQSMFVLMCSAW